MISARAIRSKQGILAFFLSSTFFVKLFELGSLRSYNENFLNLDPISSDSLLLNKTSSLEDVIGPMKEKKEEEKMVAAENTAEQIYTRKIINFHLSPKKFVKTLVDCIKDNPNCSIYFHHVGKIGGSTIESRMFKAFPFHRSKPRQRTCCSNRVMEDFSKFKKYYCTRIFTSYQVRSSQFEKVVSDCMEVKPKGTRAIALVGIREPAARTVSNIHQQCGKNIDKRKPEFVKACENCNHENYTEVFDEFAEITNRDYRKLLRTVNVSTIIPNVVSMTYDITDIDLMFKMLEANFTDKSFFLKTNKNRENVTLCDFGMKSGMFKKLKPSLEIYKQFTSGIFTGNPI